MKKNGFTLIELLAVIAILAIILLIAVPMVLSTIGTSRDNTLTASARMLWDAAEKCVSMNTIDPANCTLPTVHATARYSGFRNANTNAGMEGGTDSGEITASNWRLLGTANSSQRFVVAFAANSTNISRVTVNNNTTTGSVLTGRRCYIDSKTGPATCTG